MPVSPIPFGGFPPGGLSAYIRSEGQARKADLYADRMGQFLEQAPGEMESLMDSLSRAYMSRSSRGAQAARSTAISSGFTPLEAGQAAEDVNLQALQEYYSMVPQLRLNFLDTIAPLYGQLAGLQSGMAGDTMSMLANYMGPQGGGMGGGMGQPALGGLYNPGMMNLLQQMNAFRSAQGAQGGGGPTVQGTRLGRPDYSNMDIGGGFLAPSQGGASTFQLGQQPFQASGMPVSDVTREAGISGGGRGTGAPTFGGPPTVEGIEQRRTALLDKIRGLFGAGTKKEETNAGSNK